MDIHQWIESTPEQFPEFLDKTTHNHNPVIGASQIDTLHNLLDMLALIQEIFLFPKVKNSGIEFDEQVTSGMGCILACMIDALDFEVKHRPYGGLKED